MSSTATGARCASRRRISIRSAMASSTPAAAPRPRGTGCRCGRPEPRRAPCSCRRPRSKGTWMRLLLTPARGRIHHAASGRSVGYGEVASAAAAVPPPDLGTVPLKRPEQFTIIGRPGVGIDSARIVKGEPIFGCDTRLPGMLYAVYEVAPAHGGRLVKADTDAAKRSPGVRYVLPITGNGDADTGLADGVAIVATNWWLAEQARSKLTVEWDLSAAK